MKTLKKIELKLRYLGYSEKTIETYLCYIGKFFEDENIKDPYQVRTYHIVNYLESKEYSSNSQQNQIIGALKIFARFILNKKNIHLNKIQRPRKERKLPRVIDAELLAIKIGKITNLKHKAILALGLSCGLRISEVVNLKWEHLDRDRNILNVINGKGKKDRCCVLNDNMIKLLESYWREHKSKVYVFNGQKKPKYSTTSIQKIVKRHIHRKASYHVLRHSYATYALDNGTQTKPLSISMGHNSVKTTEIYHHVSTNSLKTIKQAM
jgi:site-specific recombinase XerD